MRFLIMCDHFNLGFLQALSFWVDLELIFLVVNGYSLGRSPRGKWRFLVHLVKSDPRLLFSDISKFSSSFIELFNRDVVATPAVVSFWKGSLR